MYLVYDKNNMQVTITDEQLLEAYKQKGEELPIELIIAMGASHNKMYVPRLQEALYHQTMRVRIKSMHSLLSIGDTDSLDALRKKEQSIPEEDFLSSISEKAILQSIIIRLENGPEGAEKAFFNEGVHPAVKNKLLYNYSSTMILTLEDVQFVIKALEAYVNKSESWMLKLKKTSYEDAIIKGLESLWRASEQKKPLMDYVSSVFIEKLVEIGSQILKMKIDSYTKEVIVIFAKYLKPQYAYSMLEPIVNSSIRGDIKRELEKTLQILQMDKRNED